MYISGSIGEMFTDIWADKVNAFTVYLTDALTTTEPTKISHLNPTPDPECEGKDIKPDLTAPSCYVLVSIETVVAHSYLGNLFAKNKKVFRHLHTTASQETEIEWKMAE